jgi:hypothetical protein
MKKIAVIINLIILFGLTCIAQNKMVKTEFEHLIDYANCQYLMAFIENYDAGKPYIKDTYEKSVKLVLQKSSLDDLNSIPSFEIIKGLFQGNSNNAALQLAETINKRKLEYEHSSDNGVLLKLLTAESWRNINLTSTATIVQNDIRRKYNLGSVSQQEIVNDKTIENSEKVEELQEKNQTLQQRVEILENQINELKDKEPEPLNVKFWIVLIVNWFVMIVLFLIARKRFHQTSEPNRDNIISTVLESQRIANRFFSNDYNKTTPNLKLIEEKIALLEKHVIQLQNKEDSKGEKEVKGFTETKKSTTSDDKFFKSKNGKILIEELYNSTDASFRVFNITGNDAKFEYCGGVINQDFFTDVCSFANNPSDVPNKTRITTTIPGTVKKVSNNKWEVVQKAKIKFE